MTTILSAHADGRKVGSCTAKCYNAKGKKCRCVCLGFNHGVGYTQALLNTAAGIETTFAALQQVNPNADDFYLKAQRWHSPQIKDTSSASTQRAT